MATLGIGGWGAETLSVCDVTDGRKESVSLVIVVIKWA